MQKDEHKIICKEPIFYETIVEYDKDKKIPITNDGRPLDPVMSIFDASTYKCTCGEKFEDYIRAEEHLIDMNEE